jgi:predicted TIM-barrel fold metal-dependent hydrolase
MAYVDAHVHVWTDDTDAYPLAPGFTRQEMAPPTFTPEELLAHARPCGVDRIILVQMSYYGTDNRYMLDTMAAYPGVFGGIAVIDEGSDAVEGEMDRLLALGVRGFRIGPTASPAGDWLAAPGYARMFAHAADTNQAMCCLIDTDALPDLARMCRTYPETPVVIDHLCRIGVDGTIREADVVALCEMAQCRQVTAKVSAYYALGAKQAPYLDLLPLIREVISAFGAQRLMWATDCPFQVAHGTYEASLALIRDHLGCTPEEREWLLGRTAERVFG